MHVICGRTCGMHVTCGRTCGSTIGYMYICDIFWQVTSTSPTVSLVHIPTARTRALYKYVQCLAHSMYLW